MLTRIISGPLPFFILLVTTASALVTSGIKVMKTAGLGSLRLGILEVWTYPPLYGMLAVIAGCAMLLCLRTNTRTHQVFAGIASVLAVLCVLQATTGFLTKSLESEKRQLVTTLNRQPLNPLELIICQVIFEDGCIPEQQSSL